jgi:hypothetical protein
VVQLDAITACSYRQAFPLCIEMNTGRADWVQLCAELALSAIAARRSKRQAQKRLLLSSAAISITYSLEVISLLKADRTRSARWKLKAADRGPFLILNGWLLQFHAVHSIDFVREMSFFWSGHSH